MWYPMHRHTRCNLRTMGLEQYIVRRRAGEEDLSESELTAKVFTGYFITPKGKKVVPVVNFSPPNPTTRYRDICTGAIEDLPDGTTLEDCTLVDAKEEDVYISKMPQIFDILGAGTDPTVFWSVVDLSTLEQISKNLKKAVKIVSKLFDKKVQTEGDTQFVLLEEEEAEQLYQLNAIAGGATFIDDYHKDKLEYISERFQKLIRNMKRNGEQTAWYSASY